MSSLPSSYIRVEFEINITRIKFGVVRGTSNDPFPTSPGRCFLDGRDGSPYKVPQRNDAKDGAVRNLITQGLVIVGMHTAEDG